MPTLTPEGKQLLSTTIRGLRARLLRDIQDEAERRYRLSIPAPEAGLDEAHRRRRERLDGWLEEQIRASKPRNDKERKAVRERMLQQAVKEAGATLINRLILIRHLEAMGLAKPEVVTGGWSSKGYREFRDFGPSLLDDETEGYSTLLQIVFDDLAIDLPGLFGDVGLTKLFPVPPATLREVVTQLDIKELDSAWTDDTTLGWVYQYWNDPEREALDAKINDGGKIAPHEIAAKTQMFTERYMVEWLLQNTLGLTWLCICKKNGWAPDADRVLPLLDARRDAWRRKRELAEVQLDALMPVEGQLEEAWKFYVPQPIPDDAVANAPDSIHDLKLLDPACGSGHFLVIAFNLLVVMYREEARHRNAAITENDIAEAILTNNLHGVDIDARAIQIAAAALYLKARGLSPVAQPRRINLVAPTLQLGNLSDDDPSLAQLRSELKRDVGIPEDLTRKLVSSLAGVDYLGVLLKVDSAVEEALKAVELDVASSGTGQGDLYGGLATQQVKLSRGEAKATVLDKLEGFLAKHSASEDLGLRLGGEQLASGVRFVRTVQEDTYDVVVGNPPYQSLSKASLSDYVARNYSRSKADLYAAFLERGVELAKEDGGVCGLLTMRGWMFLGQFKDMRKNLLATCDLRSIGDFDRGAFDEVPNEILAVAAPILRRAKHPGVVSIASQPTPLADNSYDRQRTNRKRAAVLCQVGRFEFNPQSFRAIEGEPIVYWWSTDFLRDYAAAPKFEDVAPVRNGLQTNDNERFLRLPWEVASNSILRTRTTDALVSTHLSRWVPYIKGGESRCWFEPLSIVIRWNPGGLQVKALAEHIYGSYTRSVASEDLYFALGVAFTTTGANFKARIHRFSSVFGNKGRSVFHPSPSFACACLNTKRTRFVAESLSPGLDFTTGDVNRLPVFSVQLAEQIVKRLDAAFTEHESHREPSVEFIRPGRSSWRYAQDWAERAVDRPDGEALPRYEPHYDEPDSESSLSYAIGVALGRHETTGNESSILPAGILFISPEAGDSLEHAACSLVHEAWRESHGHRGDVRTYLRTSFFSYHRALYENRPIYFPLSSTKRSFVVFIAIHRWQDDTLNVLLADNLMPAKRRLEGELEDLRKTRAQDAGKSTVEKRFADLQRLLAELLDFIDKVSQIAECGAPPTDDGTQKREVDARFVIDLDDGVMVNSAALWPLLEPQWKDPKKWWKELANAQGRKDYDWAHLAARYFPKRVRGKCVADPSLAAAHACFWELHPIKAYTWEVRLQGEMGAEFTIDEPGSDAARERFLKEHGKEAEQLRAAEMKRRERKGAKGGQGDGGSLFDQDGQDGEAANA